MGEYSPEPSMTVSAWALSNVVSVARYLIFGVFVGPGIGCHGDLLIGVGGDVNKVAPAKEDHARVRHWSSHGPFGAGSARALPGCGPSGFQASGLARRFQPWNGDKSPASQASRSPGVLRSQSGRTSLLTSRRSCHRS